MTTTEETITMIVLEADTGKVLTDGNTYSQKVYLPAEADTTVWTEVDETEKPDNWDAPPPPPEPATPIFDVDNPSEEAIS